MRLSFPGYRFFSIPDAAEVRRIPWLLMSGYLSGAVQGGIG
jgi:hypothetical protein